MHNIGEGPNDERVLIDTGLCSVVEAGGIASV